MRRFEIKNLADRDREVRFFLHHDFHIAGHKVGDTAYYEPDRRAVLDYKGSRWFLINGALVANALNRAGYLDLPRALFQFAQKALNNRGYLLHKYSPDGSLASSRHLFTGN